MVADDRNPAPGGRGAAVLAPDAARDDSADRLGPSGLCGAVELIVACRGCFGGRELGLMITARGRRGVVVFLSNWVAISRPADAR